MLYEFLHTFGETLGFDMESLPSLDSLQRALLYDSEAEEELLSVMTHLLVCSIEDPGIPHPNRHTTLLGQTLKQADITTTNVSEILRIYLQANGLGDMKMPAADKITSSPLKLAAGEYPDTEAFLMSEWLKRKPFLSLNPTQKASILGFMVNELLQNKAVIGQIEGAIEGQNTARRYCIEIIRIISVIDFLFALRYAEIDGSWTVKLRSSKRFIPKSIGHHLSVRQSTIRQRRPVKRTRWMIRRCKTKRIIRPMEARRKTKSLKTKSIRKRRMKTAVLRLTIMQIKATR